MVKTNSLKAWTLAARPKTLSAAAVPVMIGVAFAFRDTLLLKEDVAFQWIPALLCLLFAWVMQIDSNLVNDYFDFKHGNDDETRLGPKRACAEGWITLGAMKKGIALTTLLGCAIGLPLVLYGGWEMILVGICCVIFCFLYTLTLSYHGLGDLLVLLFFGIVPVGCTYAVVMPEGHQLPPTEVFFASVACGLVVDTLLMVNNFRDRENDLRSGKRTLVILLGEKASIWVYKHLGFVGLLIMGIINYVELMEVNRIAPVYILFLGYALLHRSAYAEMIKIRRGAKLNKVLGLTARNIFVFGLTSVATILSVLLFA